MTTRPTLDTTPEDASLAKWTRDVEGFVEELIGNERVPAAPAQVKATSQTNSVKVTWRSVNEVGVSEYQIFRGPNKNFAGDRAELIATVTQAVDPAGTDIIYTDPEATEKSFYFVRAVKGMRRPKIVGQIAGFGTAVVAREIGEGAAPGGTIPGFTGAPGSMLYINDASKVDEDHENLFYNSGFKAIVAGPAGYAWGPHNSPDVFLIRDNASDALAMARGSIPQRFRVYEARGGVGPAITSRLLLNESDPADLTVYVTSSISPAANKLILAFVVGTDLGFAGPILVNSITGAGLTWVEEKEVQMDTIASPRQAFACYRALGAGATPGALTVTFDGPAAAAQFIVIEFTNCDTTGTNGSGAIVQSVVNVADSGLSITATLAAFQSAVNATVGGFSSGGTTGTVWTPGAGFAEIAETPGAPDRPIMAQFRNDNDTSVDATHSNNSDIAVIALELKNAVQPTSKYVEMKAFGASGEFEVMAQDDAGSFRELIIGTRHLADTVVRTDDIEVARFGADASLALNVPNVTEGLFFDGGTIHAGRGSIWLGVDPGSRTTANYSIGGFGDTQTRINADTTVRFFIDDTVEYASYSSISVEWRFRRRVFMEGQVDTEQLLVRGHSVQTANIFVVDNDAGDDLLSVDPSGVLEVNKNPTGGGILRIYETFDSGVNERALVIDSLDSGWGSPAVVARTTAGATNRFIAIGAEGGGIVFVAGSSSVPRWRMNAGSFFPETDNVDDIGKGTPQRPRDIYLSGRIIQGQSGSAQTFGATIPVNYTQFRITGPFTSFAGSNFAAKLWIDGQITGAALDTVALYGMTMDPSIRTQTATESIANIATLNLEEPNITDLLTGDITVASTLRIGGAPDEGLTNWALNVVSGAVNLGGSVTMGAPVLIDGTADVVQFTVRGHSTQTSDIVLVEDDALAKRLAVENSGRTRVEGTFGIAIEPNQVGGFVGPAIYMGAAGFTPTVSLVGVVGTVSLLTGDTLVRIDVGGGQGASWSTSAHISHVSTIYGASVNAPRIANEATLRTNPVFSPNRSDTGTGVGGGVGSPEVSIIVSSVEIARFDPTGIRLVAAALGNDVPGRCGIFERNTNVGAEGPAPASVELEAADGASLFLWSDDDGDLRIHTAKATGSTGTPTVDANTAGFKLSPLERAHFHFASRIGSFGVEFAAGGYTFSTTDANLTQASATVTIGTANHPYYAHAFLVAAAAGAASGGTGLVEIEVSGTSIDDNGVRTAADTEVLVADITAMATNQYFETTKKWIGTVTWTLQVAGGGTHTTFNADFNYGLAKYEDFGNMDFEITGLELTGRAGATDTGFNVELCEHKATGWTYAATGFVAGLGTALVDVAGILSTESDLAAGEEFAFKKLNVSSQIAGSVAEGYILRVTTGANASVETMNITVTVKLN